ncbi:fluoride efflux transporter CrcB [Streptomyces sp. NPDC127072]|uniref:fluoride efflux transporter CrcB n=1 Tax=Streptomyces sp. NPDC127072 TaxID=3347129 RepID=UPI0036509B33
MTVPRPERAGRAGVPTRPASPWQGQGPVVATVALGGATGASARYGASLLWPAAPGGFPWTTFWVNVVGCAVIGVFMVVSAEVWADRRLVRPFFGTGVLGGFTTFSTYAVDVRKLVDEGHAGTGFLYLAATLFAALAAVWLAASAARRALGHLGGGESVGERAGRRQGPGETDEEGKKGL